MIKKLLFFCTFLITHAAYPLSFLLPDHDRIAQIGCDIALMGNKREIDILVATELNSYSPVWRSRILDYWFTNAVEAEDFKRAKIFLAHGAQVNPVSSVCQNSKRKHKTFLMERAERGSAKQVAFLLKHGADPLCCDARGAHVWHHAVNNKFFDKAASIFRLLIDKADINYVGAHGDTALHEAARSAKLFVVRELLRLGADINAQDDKGFTPLDTVLDRVRWGELEHGCKKDCLAVILFLRERGAKAGHYSVSDLLPEEDVRRTEQAQQFLVTREQKRGWRAARSFFGGNDGGSYGSNNSPGDAYVLLEDAEGDCAQGQCAGVAGSERSTSENKDCESGASGQAAGPKFNCVIM